MNAAARLNRRPTRRRLPVATFRAVAFLSGLLLGWMVLPDHSGLIAVARGVRATLVVADQVCATVPGGVAYLNAMGEAAAAE